MAKVLIAINNYNYGRFIDCCVRSALNQSYRDVNVLVIDDGSTDSSLAVFDKLASNYPSLQIKQKVNGGQLSAFNTIGNYLEGIEWVFFLDADDFYSMNYVQTVLDAAPDNVDVVYCGERIAEENVEFGQYPDCKTKMSMSVSMVPCSVHITLVMTRVIMRPTSGIVVRASKLKELLPIPFEDMWRISADVAFAVAASLHGARIAFLHNVVFNRRRHGQNAVLGNQINAKRKVENKINTKRLIEHIADKKQITRRGSHLRAMVEAAGVVSDRKRQINVPETWRVLADWLFGRWRRF